MPVEQDAILRQFGLDYHTLQILQNKYSILYPEYKEFVLSWHEYFIHKDKHKKKVLQAFLGAWNPPVPPHA